MALRFLRTPGLCATLWNCYGATEAECTYCALRAGDEARLAPFPEAVPAGVPQAYVDVWVMRPRDDDDEEEEDELVPVRAGQTGEVCFGGGGEGFMAVGYHRNQAARPPSSQKHGH